MWYREQFKNWMLPIAMIVGGVFHSFFASLAFLTPYLIFLMLLVPYCKLPLRASCASLRSMSDCCSSRSPADWVSTSRSPRIDPLLAQGTFICAPAPTATSAAVVAGTPGGTRSRLLATYCLLSNMVVAPISPVVFSFVGSQVSLPLLDSRPPRIGRQTIPLNRSVRVRRRTGPATLLWPRAYRALRQRQSISFYLWAVSLTIVMGNTISFLIRQDSSRYGDELLLAGASLVACVCQFVIGRRIGRKYDLKISGAQGLGQKNTVLAIWMAQTYLLPIASVGPAAYVVWQNFVNSYQIYKKDREAVKNQI